MNAHFSFHTPPVILLSQNDFDPEFVSESALASTQAKGLPARRRDNPVAARAERFCEHQTYVVQCAQDALRGPAEVMQLALRQTPGAERKSQLDGERIERGFGWWGCDLVHFFASLSYPLA